MKDLIGLEKASHRNIAVFRMSGIGPALPMLAGGCRSQLLPDDLRRFKKADGVIHRFGHLGFPVCPMIRVPRLKDLGSGKASNGH
jgi:hypothetical protein